jgi:hypothetical protein
LDKDEALFYALLKFGRLCPDAMFMDKPRPEIEEKTGQWVVKIKHYHNVSGKHAIQHTYWYKINENRDDAEYECRKTDKGTLQ